MNTCPYIWFIFVGMGHFTQYMKNFPIYGNFHTIYEPSSHITQMFALYISICDVFSFQELCREQKCLFSVQCI